jgi:hypothetical protein
MVLRRLNDALWHAQPALIPIDGAINEPSQDRRILGPELGLQFHVALGRLRNEDRDQSPLHRLAYVIKRRRRIGEDGELERDVHLDLIFMFEVRRHNCVAGQVLEAAFVPFRFPVRFASPYEPRPIKNRKFRHVLVSAAPLQRRDVHVPRIAAHDLGYGLGQKVLSVATLPEQIEKHLLRYVAGQAISEISPHELDGLFVSERFVDEAFPERTIGLR